MALISIATPFHIDLEFRTASLGKRILAWIIDGVILFLYELAFSEIVEDHLPSQEALQVTILVAGMVLPVVLYHFLMEVFFKGQSIGKMALGIRVVGMLGNTASLSQYLIRLLFRAWFLVPVVVSVFTAILYELGVTNRDWLFAIAMLLLLGVSAALFLYVAANKKGQRLGDTLANTLVIETRAKSNLSQTIYQDIADEHYQVRYPEVMRLSDRDINNIHNLLTNSRNNRNLVQYIDRIAHRIAEALNLEAPLDSRQFLEQLLRDYNFLTEKN